MVCLLAGCATAPDIPLLPVTTTCRHADCLRACLCWGRKAGAAAAPPRRLKLPGRAGSKVLRFCSDGAIVSGTAEDLRKDWRGNAAEQTPLMHLRLNEPCWGR